MKTEYNFVAEMDSRMNPSKIKKIAVDKAVDEALYNMDKAAELLDILKIYGAAEIITKIMEHIPVSLEK